QGLVRVGGCVPGCDIAIGHASADRSARAGIIVSYYTSRAVARCIESGNDRAVFSQHLRTLVGKKSALCSQIAGLNLNRIKRSFCHRTQARIRFVRRITCVTVKRAVTFMEILVLPSSGHSVKSL